MYIPPVIIPGRKHCADNYSPRRPCYSPRRPRYSPRRPCYPPRYPQRRPMYRQTPSYLDRPDELIRNLLQSRRQITIPPLPPPPPRPPRNLFKPIIQMMQPGMMQPGMMNGGCECALEQCECKLNKYKRELKRCNCNLESCMYEEEEY